MASNDPVDAKMVLPSLESPKDMAASEDLVEPLETLAWHMSTPLMKGVATFSASKATKRGKGKGGPASDQYSLLTRVRFGSILKRESKHAAGWVARHICVEPSNSGFTRPLRTHSYRVLGRRSLKSLRPRKTASLLSPTCPLVARLGSTKRSRERMRSAQKGKPPLSPQTSQFGAERMTGAKAAS